MKSRDTFYAEVRYRRSRFDPWIRPECSNYEATIDGGPGNDFIEGSPGDDRLIGGPGNDSVEGKKGRDVCQGERVRDCEKRL